MGVTLQLILVTLLVLAACDRTTESKATTQQPATTPNGTEINNRDLNKIIKTHPKTEIEIKNHESFPIKLGKSESYVKQTKNDSQEKEEFEKPRQNSSRSIDVDDSKFPNFHSKNSEGFTRHPSFDSNSDLTTPTSKIFDKRFKETVESVEQKLDDDELDEEDEEGDHNSYGVENSMASPADNSSLDFEATRTFVNNETVDKNSIHKTVNVESTKKINFESLYNKTVLFNDEVTEKRPTTTTGKNSIMKETVNGNNIENDLQASSNNKAVAAVTSSTSSTIRTTITQIVTTTTPSPTEGPSSDVPSAAQTTIIQETTPLSLAPETTTEQQHEQTTTDPASPLETTTAQPEPADDVDGLQTTTVLSQLVVTTTVENNEKSRTTTIQSQRARDIEEPVEDATTTTTTAEITTIGEETTTLKFEETETLQLVDTTTLKSKEIITGKSEELTTVMVEFSTDKVEEPSFVKTDAFTTTDSQETTTKMEEESATKIVEETTTTQYTFVPIEEKSKERTTHSEIMNPRLNHMSATSTDELILNHTTPAGKNDVTTEMDEDPATTPVDGEYTKEGEAGNKGKIAAIVISCVGAVCLVLLAGLLYVMKKRQKRLNYGPRCRPVSLDDYSIDNLSVYNSVRRKTAGRISKRSFGNPAFEDPVAPSHPLNFQALAKFATNHEDIKAEFEEIPQITARTSELPEGCDTKNRYANVIPLPETRVYLKPIDGYPNSDYINANYVTGPKNVKGYYIATQGPMHNTVDDFWRMIWEQQAKVILMLTHLVENGLEKCVDYLPESEVLETSRTFGDYQIILKKREVKEKYIISSLQLKNMVSNSWREVTHFWYLGWPEKGVPSEANSLIAFLIEARSYMKNSTLDKKEVNGIQNGNAQHDHNPVVVHCSPGTGRTGVAIASDIAIREFEKTRLVDIPRIVYRIRRDRANAVQTKEQYVFIYKVVSLYATKLTGGALENL